ncbi:MAG: hypothetical protein GWN62_23890, partial [Aliifodinibius sp.]|nr:hypothetical protein [Fodinibius sp.]
MNIENFTENRFVKSDTIPVNIVVYDSAVVAVDSVVFSQDTISQNMNLDSLEVTVSNNGVNNADAIIDSIVIPKFNYSKVINSVILANNARVFNLSPFVSSAPGVVPFNIDVYWHDQFIGGQNIAAFPDSVVVLNQANIQITNISHDTLVSAGQDSVPVDVSV